MRRLITVLWLMIAADWMAAGPFAATQPRIAPAPAADSRLDRVTAWLAAVQRHQPGADDEALAQVALWSNDDLRLLWIDLNVVVHLMRNPRGHKFQSRASQSDHRLHGPLHATSGGATQAAGVRGGRRAAGTAVCSYAADDNAGYRVVRVGGRCSGREAWGGQQLRPSPRRPAS